MRKSPLFGAVLLLSLLAPPGEAQETAALTGRVVDEDTGDPIASARILLRGREPVGADELGRFSLTDLPSGQIEVTIRALGYADLNVKLRLTAGRTLDQLFPMEFTGARLPDVEVRARVERLAPRYAEFERRRERGQGAFFRWDELKAGGYSSVGDALRTVRGVRIQCDQRRFECFAIMARSPQCKPVWWIDGTEAGSFHENTPIRDIYGIEIYRGPGEIPAEYSGSNAACGVIVLWTKSRQYR